MYLYKLYLYRSLYIYIPAACVFIIHKSPAECQTNKRKMKMENGNFEEKQKETCANAKLLPLQLSMCICVAHSSNYDYFPMYLAITKQTDLTSCALRALV